MVNSESLTVIAHMKSTFAKFGIPYTVMSDNGPEFSSMDFRLFAKTWDFVHDMSSLYYPKSNGMVERTIQTVKKSILMSLDANEDPYLSLLSFHTTPGLDGCSPAFKLMG